MKGFATGTVLVLLVSTLALAAPPVTRVPMHSAGTATYYVQGKIEGYGEIKLLVDTGSGYSAISEDTLDVLRGKGAATYLRELNGIMADGSLRVVPVYLISGINLGGKCMIRSVEVAVFPDDTRPILGLSALKKVAPFVFSLDPPNLLLSRCNGGAA
ncbi:MAG: retroviral-like aspartic protease family protein [Pseudomonadota bacterium]